LRQLEELQQLLRQSVSHATWVSDHHLASAARQQEAQRAGSHLVASPPPRPQQLPLQSSTRLLVVRLPVSPLLSRRSLLRLLLFAPFPSQPLPSQPLLSPQPPSPQPLLRLILFWLLPSLQLRERRLPSQRLPSRQLP